VARPVRPSPPPLEANDELATAVITAGWAVALVVLLVLRDQIPASERWWLWTCLAGLVMGLFGLWYVPRVKRSRARAVARRAQDAEPLAARQPPAADDSDDHQQRT
jgi:ABC-type nickel/cobalt efflux system permease component RcnA